MHGENILASNDESSFGFFPFTSLTRNFESLDRRPITDSGHIGLKLRALSGKIQGATTQQARSVFNFGCAAGFWQCHIDNSGIICDT
jgi:hypothetical protein